MISRCFALQTGTAEGWFIGFGWTGGEKLGKLKHLAWTSNSIIDKSFDEYIDIRARRYPVGDNYYKSLHYLETFLNEGENKFIEMLYSKNMIGEQWDSDNCVYVPCLKIYA